jgi:hypothetical protein
MHLLYFSWFCGFEINTLLYPSILCMCFCFSSLCLSSLCVCLFHPYIFHLCVFTFFIFTFFIFVCLFFCLCVCVWRVFYIIENILECICLKWAWITHLNISNTSYGQKKVGNQIGNLIPDHLKLKIDLIPSCVGGMQHTIGKLSMRTTTLFYTSFQSKVCTRSYGASKSREFQLWQFWNSHLWVAGQNVIWMWSLWKGT